MHSDGRKAIVAGDSVGRPAAVISSRDSGYERAHQWRDATRELVLAAATAMASSDRPGSRVSISITVTGNALSNELLLADTGSIVLTPLREHEGVRGYPMRVIPMRLDTLSDLPAIRVLGCGVTEPTLLRLEVELTARNPHTEATSVMACEYDSVLLDAQTPLVVLGFRPSQDQPHG